MHALARFITRRWRSGPIALFAILASLVIIGVIGTAERIPAANDALPRGADSTRAALLAERLPQAESSVAVILFSREGEKLSPADLQFVTDRLTGLQDGPMAPPVTSDDGTAAIGSIAVDEPDATGTAERVGEIRKAVKAGLPAGLTAQVTGPAAISADLAAVFEGANVRLLIATASVVALLLVLTYRSPVLWLVPLTVVGLADQVAAVAATHSLKALGVTWDESTVGILSVLVFGAGTDYALLLISRYRDELRRLPDRREAMTTALTRTVEAITASSVTVFVGLVTLLLSAFPATRGLGLACAIGVIVAASFVMLVLPPTLVVFGRWVFWPKVPAVGQPSLTDGRSIWRRVGDAVASRPAVYALATLAVLGIAAGGLTQIRTGLSDSDQFLTKPEAISASERLAESFPAGSADPARVLTTADPASVEVALGSVEGVAGVRTGASGGGVTELAAVIAAQPSTEEAKDTVRAMRTAVADIPETYVGGSEARALDAGEASARDRLVVIPIILALVFLALVILLRSVVAPIVLVMTVVLTYLSSLGLSWVLFTQVFGFERLDSGAPLLAFVFLVALGVDYNIFLVTRAREESLGHGTREGMLRGLAATGGVITSAGILLAAVFAVLGVLPLVVLAQLGVIICVGVLLDTLVVRTVIVPAIALLLGDRFWWPRRLGSPGPNAVDEAVVAGSR